VSAEVELLEAVRNIETQIHILKDKRARIVAVAQARCPHPSGEIVTVADHSYMRICALCGFWEERSFFDDFEILTSFYRIVDAPTAYRMKLP